MRLAVETGVAGLSIEDSIGPRLQRTAAAAGTAAGALFDLDTAVERVRAARRAIDAAGGDVLLVGRAECFLVGLPDIDDAVARLEAYATPEPIASMRPASKAPSTSARVVEAVHPKPVNLLVMAPGDADACSNWRELGVRRVSVGGALARAAWGGFMRAAREIAEHGRLRTQLANAASGRTLKHCSTRRDRLVRARARAPTARHGGGGIIDRALPRARTPAR